MEISTTVAESTAEKGRPKRVLTLIYCPYTDQAIPESQSSPEHIVPLSLGGVNGLEIPVDAEFNSQVGSKLDGALANEFLFALKRTKFDARGHSGKKPVALIRTATYGDDSRPAQAQFHSKRGMESLGFPG